MTRLSGNDYGIPVLAVTGLGLADTWERSVLAVYRSGCDIKTQYDKPNDPPSRDCTMLLVVQQPLAEPMIHRCIPGFLTNLQAYVDEILKGTNDHRVGEPGNTIGRPYYTYHSRLFAFDVQDADHHECLKRFNQIEDMCKQLALVPYTRRAQAVTWKVWEDNSQSDPPCLQSIWCRMTPSNEIEQTLGRDANIIETPKWILSMDVRLRSNDAYRAAFMNMFALVQLQKYIAARISELKDEPVSIGRYCHIADSYHIYGSTMAEFEGSFLKTVETKTWEQRTRNSDCLNTKVYPLDKE